MKLSGHRLDVALCIANGLASPLGALELALYYVMSLLSYAHQSIRKLLLRHPMGVAVKKQVNNYELEPLKVSYINLILIIVYCF